jgi:tetratricopeptide (TPR) repeat protein
MVSEKGYLALEKGNVDEAIRFFKEDLQQKPEDTKARNNLAVAYMRQSRYEEAFNELQKVIAQRPDDPRAHYNLALVYYYKKLYDEEIAEYRKSIALLPSHYGAHLNLGHALLSKGDKIGALEQYQWVIERNPDNAKINFTLGILYSEMKADQKAAERFRHYLAIDPKGKYAQEAKTRLLELSKKLSGSSPVQ